MDKINWNLVIILVIIIVLALVLNSLFGSEAKGENKKIASSGVFDFTKYLSKLKKAPKGMTPIGLPVGKAGKIAGQLVAYMDMTDVPEEKVIAVLKGAITKGDITTISYAYSTNTKKDLYSELKNALNDDEQKILFGYINKLPIYVKIKK